MRLNELYEPFDNFVFFWMKQYLEDHSDFDQYGLFRIWLNKPNLAEDLDLEYLSNYGGQTVSPIVESVRRNQSVNAAETLARMILRKYVDVWNHRLNMFVYEGDFGKLYSVYDNYKLVKNDSKTTNDSMTSLRSTAGSSEDTESYTGSQVRDSINSVSDVGSEGNTTLGSESSSSSSKVGTKQSDMSVTSGSQTSDNDQSTVRSSANSSTKTTDNTSVASQTTNSEAGVYGFNSENPSKTNTNSSVNSNDNSSSNKESGLDQMSESVTESNNLKNVSSNSAYNESNVDSDTDSTEVRSNTLNEDKTYSKVSSGSTNDSTKDIHTNLRINEHADNEASNTSSSGIEALTSESHGNTGMPYAESAKAELDLWWNDINFTNSIFKDVSHVVGLRVYSIRN